MSRNRESRRRAPVERCPSIGHEQPCDHGEKYPHCSGHSSTSSYADHMWKVGAPARSVVTPRTDLPPTPVTRKDYAVYDPSSRDERDGPRRPAGDGDHRRSRRRPAARARRAEGDPRIRARHRRRCRGIGRPRSGRPNSSASPNGRAARYSYAEPRRDRSRAGDRRTRCRHARPDAHDLRRRRIRVRSLAGWRERVPVEGRAGQPARRRDSHPRRRRRADRPIRHPPPDLAVRTRRAPARSRPTGARRTDATRARRAPPRRARPLQHRDRAPPRFVTKTAGRSPRSTGRPASTVAVGRSR